MDEEVFNRKYNEGIAQNTSRQPDYERRTYRREERWDQSQRQSRPPQRRTDYTYENRANRERTEKANAFKSSGIRKYKDYDYDGAIDDFKQALEFNPKDIATHFNIACSYSLNEEADKSLHHLDKAVELGFNDFTKIKEHDALAYVRIQPTFDAFERNGFKLVKSLEQPKEDLLNPVVKKQPAQDNSTPTTADLLEQLRKLGELKEKGLLTMEEFEAQKRKLLG